MFRKIVLATFAATVLSSSNSPSQAAASPVMPAAQPLEAAGTNNRDRQRKHYIWCHAKYGRQYDPRTDTVRPPKGRVRRCVSPYSGGGDAGGDTGWGTL